MANEIPERTSAREIMRQLAEIHPELKTQVFLERLRGATKATASLRHEHAAELGAYVCLLAEEPLASPREVLEAAFKIATWIHSMQ